LAVHSSDEISDMAKTILIILVFSCAVYFVVCLFYILFQEKFIFVPFWRKRRDGLSTLATRHDEIFIRGVEGGELHGVHIRIDRPRGCILYFHGNTGDLSRWAPIAEEFTSFGFDVIVPDYRGFGKSKGKRSEEILYSDALMWYKETAERFAEERICIYGRSLGSGVSVWLAARVRARALILETPYDNLINVAHRHAPFIPAARFMRYTFRNDMEIRNVKCPVLIAHGTKDKIVSYRLAFRLYRIAKEHTETVMVSVPGGRHSNLNGFPVFRLGLTDFFDRYYPRIFRDDADTGRVVSGRA